MKNTNKICLIAPTDNLAERAAAIIKAENLPIAVYVAALDDAANLAEKLIATGTWLFISRRGTKNYLERKLNITVIDIPMEASDYIPAIQQARYKKGNIAFFTAEDPSDELKTICFLLDIKACYYRFTDLESCASCVKQAVKEDAILGIGGAVSEQVANEMGLPYIVVENSDQTLKNSLETAIQMYHMHEQNEKDKELLEIKLERYKNILNYTHDAIITIDHTGKIEVINAIAEAMMEESHRPFEGKMIEQVFPQTRMTEILRTGQVESDQLVNINGTIVSTNRVPIIVNQQIKGVVATFRDIKSLQSDERKIRVKLHEKGLTAKYFFHDIIGSSEIIADAKIMARDFADSQFTIMLYGETGVGKEMFAQSIHNASPRRNGPFVAINCTALSKSLLESELFGYADGSFTGAKRGGKPGLFEMAHGGSIFLDEIGELPIEFQAQFLRVIQEKEVRRVGGDSIIPVDIRVIGATNRDLMELVAKGQFRKDLYYRLNVLNLNIPALCKRDNDYMEIAKLIYEKVFPDRTAAQTRQFYYFMEQYQHYDWPGNVRELHNIVERICLLQNRGVSEDKLLTIMKTMISTNDSIFSTATTVIPKALHELELEKITEILQHNNYNISQTAKELKISRSTLYRKLQRTN
jgi:PAS domain S-box-containing protein